MLISPLGLGSPGCLVDGFLSATNCGGFNGIGKYDSGAFYLTSGNPYSIGSYYRCLGRAAAVSAKRC